MGNGATDIVQDKVHLCQSNSCTGLFHTISTQVHLLALSFVLFDIMGGLNEHTTTATGRVYVPTDFDTIEKAFSGVKTAEKGIKQGLSRSITDSESPFSLYSVVDFCRSKVRRHRGV